LKRGRPRQRAIAEIEQLLKETQRPPLGRLEAGAPPDRERIEIESRALVSIKNRLECAARYFDVVGDIDVTDLLSKVTAKTLVMHVRGDLVCPIEAGRVLADGIPGVVCRAVGPKPFVPGKRAGFPAVLRGNHS
jgi:pimeloyl-ACP methyl ester carboxylesterase